MSFVGVDIGFSLMITSVIQPNRLYGLVIYGRLVLDTHFYKKESQTLGHSDAFFKKRIPIENKRYIKFEKNAIVILSKISRLSKRKRT